MQAIRTNTSWSSSSQDTRCTAWTDAAKRLGSSLMSSFKATGCLTDTQGWQYVERSPLDTLIFLAHAQLLATTNTTETGTGRTSNYLLACLWVGSEVDTVIVHDVFAGDDEVALKARAQPARERPRLLACRALVGQHTHTPGLRTSHPCKPWSPLHTSISRAQRREWHDTKAPLRLQFYPEYFSQGARG